MNGTQPRPLKHRGRQNRRGRRARVLRLRRTIAYLERVTGGPRVCDPEFGSMPLQPWTLDPNMGLPWQRPPSLPTKGDRLARVWAARGSASR
jgi:hypothetical protein